jgi:alkylation response protein AidB-like acyl-CoA dehydrogenase
MLFDLSESQHEIKRTARDLLATRASPARVRERIESGAPDTDLWRELGELGWTGIAIDDDHEGLGLGSVEAAVLLEELGYAVASPPLLGTLMAGFALSAAGSAEQRAEWLPRLAAGAVVGTLGVARDGVAELVPDAPHADLIVLVENGRARLLSAADAHIETLETLDPSRSYGRVRGTGDPLPGDARPALDRSAVAIAAELAGVCQRALDMSVAFAKDRVQFGRPIGAFQAIAHRCSEMLLATESIRSTVYQGAWASDHDAAGLPFAAALAKAVASSSAVEATTSAIQVHGGLGFTWEADVHWLYKRAQLDAQLLGGSGVHRATLTRLLRERVAG